MGVFIFIWPGDGVSSRYVYKNKGKLSLTFGLCEKSQKSFYYFATRLLAILLFNPGVNAWY